MLLLNLLARLQQRVDELSVYWFRLSTSQQRHALPGHNQLARCHITPEPPDLPGLCLPDLGPLDCPQLLLLHSDGVIKAEMALIKADGADQSESAEMVMCGMDVKMCFTYGC